MGSSKTAQSTCQLYCLGWANAQPLPDHLGTTGRLFALGLLWGNLSVAAVDALSESGDPPADREQWRRMVQCSKEAADIHRQDVGLNPAHPSYSLQLMEEKAIQTLRL
jgi:hypothetical protein